jgi:glycosyltransferase involved in cell wall biosynthesis
LANLSHAFAVCAYKESPFLTDCLDSIFAQTQQSEVFIATSTPSPYLSDIAKRYSIPLYVGSHKSGIGRDWNYAISKATSDWVTIAHQDDIYLPTYTERIMSGVDAAKNPIVAYTDYSELRNGLEVTDNTLLRIKRLMNTALIPKVAQRNKLVRRRVLSVGNPICTPSVAYNMQRFPELRFDDKMGTNLDWDMYHRLSGESGQFVYLPYILVQHRIHEESETSAGIEGGYRQAEDYEMFHRYWPTPIAKTLAKQYARSYASNS